jgi:hypothetical protein
VIATLHRKCGCGGTCGGCAKETPQVPQVVHDVLRSSGQPLDAATRTSMEPRFNHDFSKVRVHSGDRAAESASAVGALAYAAGNHIVLGERSLPNDVMAHELAHVAQSGGGDALPERIAPADSPAEREADRAAEAATRVTQRHEGTLHRYRDKTATNFGVADKVSTFKEAVFTDSKKQPWVEKIHIVFDNSTSALNPDTLINETIPIGTLTATYNANPAKLSPITLKIAGGTPTLGLTDIVKGKEGEVTRIEGVGYNDVPQKGGEGPHKKYTKIDPATKLPGAASMHMAIFFKGKQAIHGGSLVEGSHACVHVDFADPALIQLNYHSVAGRTVVTTEYTSKGLDPPCCERIKNHGFKRKGQANHPCETVDPKACP